MKDEKLKKIIEDLSYQEDQNDSDYENFCKKIGYIQALRDYKIITFKEAVTILEII